MVVGGRGLLSPPRSGPIPPIWLMRMPIGSIRVHQVRLQSEQQRFSGLHRFGVPLFACCRLQHGVPASASEAASEISGCRDHYNVSSLCRGGAICCAIAMG